MYVYIFEGEWHSDETIFRFISPCSPWNLNQMYPSIDIRRIHIHTYDICTNYLFITMLLLSRYLTQSPSWRNHHHIHTFFFFQTCISFFSFINKIQFHRSIFRHRTIKELKKNRIDFFTCINDNDDDDDDLCVMYLTTIGEVQQEYIYSSMLTI